MKDDSPSTIVSPAAPDVNVPTSSSTTFEKIIISFDDKSKIEKDTSKLREKIEALENIRDSGFATEKNLKQLMTSILEFDKAKSILRKKTNNVNRHKIFRQKKSDLLKSLASESEANKAQLKSVMRGGPGRPPL